MDPLAGAFRILTILLNRRKNGEQSRDETWNKLLLKFSRLILFSCLLNVHSGVEATLWKHKILLKPQKSNEVTTSTAGSTSIFTQAALVLRSITARNKRCISLKRLRVAEAEVGA